MLPMERREKIAEYINDKGRSSIAELVKLFNVSKATVMRDLKLLDQKKMVIRDHGGAIRVEKGTRYEPEHKMKETNAIEKKRQIAICAEQYISPGETVLLDSGTTTLMLAKQLLNKTNITVITNDIKIAETLSTNDSIELVVLGGQKRKGVYSLLGPYTEMFLGNLNVDKVFLGADAVHLEKGLMNSNIDEINTKKLMINSSNEVILLADSSKSNKIAFTKIATINDLDMVISDHGLTTEFETKLTELGVHVNRASQKRMEELDDRIE